MVNISQMKTDDKREIWQLIQQDPDLQTEITRLGSIARQLGGDVRLSYSEIVKLKNNG